MTVVSLQGTNSVFSLELVLADRFTVDYSQVPVTDTEDFLVVGTKGPRLATGRLTGSAYIDAVPGNRLLNEPLTVSGTICLK